MTIRKENIRELDPFLERERAQYENPLPSREYVLALLEKQGVPVVEEDLCQMLGIEEHEVELFTRRLRAMERDGQIMRNRTRASRTPTSSTSRRSNTASPGLQRCFQAQSPSASGR